eukprot:jgi/Botrbrau1/7604/Bobra.0159s0053.1
MSLSSLCIPALHRYQFRGCIHGACRVNILLQGFRSTPSSTTENLRARPVEINTRRAYIVKCALQQQTTPSLRTTVPATSENANDARGGVHLPASAQHTAVLDVGGMKCGGCSAAVKRILLGSGEVVSASVNLVTGMAAVSVPAVSQRDPSKTVDGLAELLTSKGFPSHVRRADDDVLQDEEKRAEGTAAGVAKERRGPWSGVGAGSVVLHSPSGALFPLPGLAHVGPLGPNERAGRPQGVCGPSEASPSWALGDRWFVDGARALYRGTPNMNSLVGVGAVTSFSVGALAPWYPGWASTPPSWRSRSCCWPLCSWAVPWRPAPASKLALT